VQVKNGPMDFQIRREKNTAPFSVHPNLRWKKRCFQDGLGTKEFGQRWEEAGGGGVCREPISPLLAGGLKKTHFLMEVQAAQEYTGVFEEAINV
jgi:hypothetical protein